MILLRAGAIASVSVTIRLMNSKDKMFNTKQLIFQELFIGSLIYVTVLGLFNDYTAIVEARSFSTILFASIVLEVLTYLTFLLKNRVISWLKNRQGAIYKILMFFCVWLIMFLSKFVFIGVIDVMLGEYIIINGFFGILFVALSVTIIHKFALYSFKKLGEN